MYKLVFMGPGGVIT